MQIATTIGPVTVLSVSGRIDAQTFSQLMGEADQRLEEGRTRLVLDLSGVDYVSSRGLIALQTITARAAARGGKAVLCGVEARVMQVLEMTGLHQRLGIFPDRAAATASFETDQKSNQF